MSRKRRGLAAVSVAIVAIVAVGLSVTSPQPPSGAPPTSAQTSPPTAAAATDPLVDDANRDAVGGYPDGTEPSQDAADAVRDGVLSEVAGLPFATRVNLVAPTFDGSTTRVVADEGVWMISQPDPGRHGGDPLLGDPTGVYGRDFIHLPTYGEVLLLDATETTILRAFPITPAATPGGLAISPRAVYCHRAADGGEPDSLLCRIDRSTQEMIVRVFPSAAGSSFDVPGTWTPEHWTIDDSVTGSLVGVLGVDGDLVLDAVDATSSFDPDTLELLDRTETG